MRTLHLSLSFFLILFLNLTVTAQLPQMTPQAEGLLPAEYIVFGISAPSEEVAWAVAFDQNASGQVPLDHKNIVLRTADGGATWTASEIEEAAGYISFDIHALDEQTAFIIGQPYGNGLPHSLFQTADGGSSWRRVLTDVAAGVWVHFFDEMNGLCVNHSAAKQTNDGGLSWANVASPPSLQLNEYTSIYSGTNSFIAVNDTVYFGTTLGYVHKSTDRGMHWTKHHTGLPADNDMIYSVAFSDGYNGLAMTSSAGNTTFARTSNGGGGWETFDGPSTMWLTNIAHVPGTEGSFVATSVFFPGALIYTEDYGENWTTVMTAAFRPIEFASPYVAWIGRTGRTNASQAALFKWEADFFVVGTEERAPSWGIEIFPNPTADHWVVKAPDELRPGLREFHLYSPSGQLMKSWKYDGSPGQNLSANGIPSGAYILKANGEKGIFSAPVVLQR